MTENLATAIADGVTVRVLSEDGTSLLPVSAHHPDPVIEGSMAAVMAETVQPADSGLWRSVLGSRTPKRWEMPPGRPPTDASERQRSFLEQFPIRAVLGVPMMVDDRLVGGVSVVRFVVEQPFTDLDEELVVACARRVAPAVDCLRRLRRLLDPV